MRSSRRFASTLCRLGGLSVAVVLLGACAASTEPTDVTTAEAEHTGATSSALTNIFSIASYENALVTGLSHTNGMGGYSYAIYQNGTLVRSGAAGTARKSPLIPWTADTPFSMMSMGKTITAAAMVQLLAQRDDIALDSPIKPYLPPSWSPDPDLDHVTFREILSHTGGLTKSVDSWSGIKTEVETNVLPAGGAVRVSGQVIQPAGVGTFFYSNTDFTLQRILIPFILDKATSKAWDDAGYGDKYTGYAFRDRVMQSIFAPLGLDYAKVDVAPIGAYPAGFYNASGTAAYFEPTDGSTTFLSGAGFWNLSVKSYGKFIDALSHGKYAFVKNGVTIDPWKYMTTPVGASNAPAAALGTYIETGAYGSYFTHSGGWSNGTSAACARWMSYPNGLTAVWVMNSGVPTASGNVTCPVVNPVKVMVDAYDNASLWVGPLNIAPL